MESFLQLNLTRKLSKLINLNFHLTVLSAFRKQKVRFFDLVFVLIPWNDTSFR